MFNLSAEQINELADELLFYAATEAGFHTDGERFFFTPESLMIKKEKNGNDYDFTEILDDFCYHFIFKLIELNELQKHEGVKQ